MKNILILLAVGVALTACNKKVIYNANLRSNLDSKTITPDKLQFYIDKDVEMRREIASNNTKITDGKIQYTKGREVELLNLKKLTPGVCITFNDTALKVAFDQQNYLTFVNEGGEQKNYVLHTTTNANGQHEILYGNQTYIVPESATHTHILVKRKDANKLKVKTKKIKGRKI